MADMHSIEGAFINEEALQSATIPDALKPPVALVGPIFLAVQTLFNMVIWAAVIPLNTIILPTQIAGLDPLNKVSTLSLIILAGGIAGLIAPPIAGALSDRTTLRLGRRRPWILGCTIGVIIGLLLMSMAQNLALLTVGFIIFAFSVNMLFAPILAIIPDKVPVRQRATVSAFIGLAQPVGTLLGTIVAAQITRTPQGAYYVLSVGFVVVAILFVLLVSEKPLSKGVLPPFSLSTFLRTFFVNPVKHRDFGYTWLARLFVILSQVVFSTFILYFLQDVVQYQRLFPGQQPAQGVAIFQLISTVLLIIATITGGIISDRLQRRKIFIIAGNILMALAAILMALFPSWTLILITGAIFGFGFGLYISADVALASQVLPETKSQGKDFGLIMSANAASQLLIPVVSFIAFGLFHGYVALYLIAALASLLGALCIVPIKSVR